MGQLSFYSADAHPRAVTDLEGVLCGRGQVSIFGRGTTARLSIVLGAPPPPLPEEDLDTPRGEDEATGGADDEATGGAEDEATRGADGQDQASRSGEAPGRLRDGTRSVGLERGGPPVAGATIDLEDLEFLDLDPDELAVLTTAHRDRCGPTRRPPREEPAEDPAEDADEPVTAPEDTPDTDTPDTDTPDTATPDTDSPRTALHDPEAEWRAHALYCAFRGRGVDAEIARVPDGRPVVRTPYRAALVPLARTWTRGAVKAVAEDFELDGPRLRLWVLAAGRHEGRAYTLGLDPHAGHTHEALLTASRRAGLGATLGGDRAHPVLRIVGRRRQGRLGELVGERPRSATDGVPDGIWPV